jgi:lysophospholipase L1-like esterase
MLALGDSYTIGEGVAPQERWPVLLAGALRESGIAIDDPQIVATTGWTTDELSAGIDATAPGAPVDLVSLLIGVNDQYRGRSPDAYRVAFTALLHSAVAFTGGTPHRVIVLSIPDWGVTPFAEGRDRERIASEIDAFNAVARDAARQQRAQYVDITPISRRAASDPALLAGDGLHPSGAMYAEWARAVLPVARRALLER